MAGVKRTTILLLSGSTRAGSTNSAALRTIHRLAPPNLRTILYEGLVHLPAFVPDIDDSAAPAAVQELRQQIDGADALLISTPEYAGTLPGSLKNLIDWTIPTGDLYHKPVAWLNVAAPGRGAGVIDTLNIVLGFATAEIIEAACRSVFVGRQALGEDGLVADPGIRAALLNVLMRIAEHVQAGQA
ncbi:MAG TPA: NAD(P)H-dependent oxidoreductase [Nannocystis exedens]|nr:NAD(P)H-dependent oxidoreductase [Nannocystis exedens]